MASSREYHDFIMDSLSSLEVSSRKMMGEYVLYYRGKVIGGIYDNRFLVKSIDSAVSHMQDVLKVIPYKGAKEMLEVENIDDIQFLYELFEAMYDELPEIRKKR
ncbi:MAG: competence protein TfoX [Ruminococcus sp.]|nr:competence protein TfoX [Ruminococcus sp.]